MKFLFILFLYMILLSACVIGGGVLHYSEFRSYNVVNHNIGDTLFFGRRSDSIKISLSSIYSCRWKYRYYTALSFFVFNENKHDTVKFDKSIIDITVNHTIFKLKESYSMIADNGESLLFKTRKLQGVYLIPPNWGLDIPFEFESFKKYTKREFEQSLLRDTLILIAHDIQNGQNIRYELKAK